MQITIVYNAALESRYGTVGEQDAEDGVLIAEKAVRNALCELGHDVSSVALYPPLENALLILEQIDTELIFNLFEGFSGSPHTEAEFAALLSARGIPYTGCACESLKLGLDKRTFKRLIQTGGINVPDSYPAIKNDSDYATVTFPCILKPNNDDASHGVNIDSIVNNAEELKRKLRTLLSTYEEEQILIEQYIDGREFNVTVTGNHSPEILAVSEIRFRLPDGVPHILSYAAKWDENSEEYKGTQVVCPAELRGEEKATIREIVERTYRLAGCRGYARIDMRMDSLGKVYVLEVNPNPDISPGSGAAIQAGVAGLDYTAFIKRIVELAVEE